LRYYGDGTGRDSYVVKDWGGYVVNYAATHTHEGHFYKTLRSGSMTQTVDCSKPGSMYHTTRNWLSPKAKRIIKEAFNQQLTLSNRLSTPKNPTRSSVSRDRDLSGVGSPDKEADPNSLAQQPSSIRQSLLMRTSNGRRYGNGRNQLGEGLMTQQNSGRGSLDKLEPIATQTPRAVANQDN
jgi:hypothetical protein